MEVQIQKVESEGIQEVLKHITPQKRSSRIVTLKHQIERSEKYYSPENRLVILNAESDEQHIMTLEEKERWLKEALKPIYHELELLRWKDRSCIRCNKLKKKKEFNGKSNVCNECNFSFRSHV
jgi:hypothetical protein